MTDCGCEKAKAELEEYLDRELNEADFQDVSDHLDNCESCSSEHLVALALKPVARKRQRTCATRFSQSWQTPKGTVTLSTISCSLHDESGHPPRRMPAFVVTAVTAG